SWEGLITDGELTLPPRGGTAEEGGESRLEPLSGAEIRVDEQTGGCEQYPECQPRRYDEAYPRQNDESEDEKQRDRLEGDGTAENHSPRRLPPADEADERENDEKSHDEISLPVTQG